MLRMINYSIAIYRNRRESFSLEPKDPHVASLYAINYVQGLQETDGGDPNQLEGTIRDTVYAPGCANIACTGNEPKKDNVAAMAASLATGSALQAAATLLQPTKLSVMRSSSGLSSSSSHVSRAFGFEAATSTQVSSSLQDDVKEFAEKCAGATKRLIRRRFNDPPVHADMKLWPFKVVSGPGDKPMIEDDNKRDSSDQRPPGGRPPGTSIPMQQLSRQGKADLRNLESFLIWNNSFSGRLGRDLNLVSLDVSTNNFTGPVPPDLCAQGVLFKLILFSNGFEGEIPYSLARCRSLYRLRMADNRVSGSIPRGLLGMLPNSTFADLSMNNLTGGIPAELIDSPRLQYLNFSHNPLGGRLPDKIWSAPGLHVFSASFATLSGNSLRQGLRRRRGGNPVQVCYALHVLEVVQPTERGGSSERSSSSSKIAKGSIKQKPPIVHISCNNVLLDSAFQACVSDFGTAKLLDAHTSIFLNVFLLGSLGKRSYLRFSIFSLVAVFFYSVYNVHASYDAEWRVAATASSTPGPPAVVEGHVIELTTAVALSRSFTSCVIDSG